MGNKIIVWSELTEKQRKSILDNHRKWLNSERGGEKLVLPIGSDLRGSNLRGSNLSGSDLSWSNLSWSDLRGSDLSGSNLRGSDLSGSDLRGSDLSWSNLSWSDLSWSNLSWSDLRWSNLRGSNLSGSDLRGSNLSGSNLRGSDLRGAIIKDGVTVKSFYQCGPQGERGDYLLSFLGSDGAVYFSTGCRKFVKHKEFLKLVSNTHGTSKYGKQYRSAVAHCVKMLKIAGST